MPREDGEYARRRSGWSWTALGQGDCKEGSSIASHMGRYVEMESFEDVRISIMNYGDSP